MTERTRTDLTNVLDPFASADPVPGGGSAAALTGALGVSLLLMVAGMSKTRTGSPEDVTDLAAAAARLRPLREDLVALVDDDSDAYRAVLAAYRLPRVTDSDIQSRRAAIAAAMRNATTTPLRTMRVCEQALREAPLIVRTGNPNAAIDAAVGSKLLFAAIESAALNVTVNLPGLQDAALASASADERQALLASATAFVREVERVIA